MGWRNVKRLFDAIEWEVVNLVPSVDDTVWKFGDGTLNWDVKSFGNITDHYMLWDASSQTLSLEGQSRLSKTNTCPPRFELKWTAGQCGLPGLNATVTPASADDAADGATKAELDTMNATDKDFEILGTNASADDVTYNSEGGLKLQTDGADGDEIILLPHLNTSQSPWTGVTWGSDKEVIWEAHITTGSDITNEIIWAGLKLTNVEPTATDADQAFFRYENAVNIGKWEAIFSIGGTDTVTATSVTVAADTEYHFKIVIDFSRIPKFYINGVLEKTGTALTDTKDFIPYIGVANDGTGAAKDITVYGQSISRKVG